jgi:hypothetical protein
MQFIIYRYCAAARSDSVSANHAKNTRNATQYVVPIATSSKSSSRLGRKIEIQNNYIPFSKLLLHVIRHRNYY